ncbi:7252_t:CDS:2 [Entrophospora sp. SA101]|nr:7252_t:CDS:2 [Entrophospora sp. SA101]
MSAMSSAMSLCSEKLTLWILVKGKWLDGSCSFDPVNYSVHLEEFVLLVYPQVEVSGSHQCDFGSDDMKDAKKLANCITSILQCKLVVWVAIKKIHL